MNGAALRPSPPPVATPPDWPHFEPFRARPPWLGGHLQTVRNLVRPERSLLQTATRTRRLLLPMGDASGDRLPAALDLPRRPREDAPLLVAIHGLGGCETSRYMLATAGWFLARGWPVLRLNLRGSLPARRHCTGWSHAGQASDLEAVLPAIAALAPPAGLLPLAYSLGGNLLLGYLGGRPTHPAIAMAISVSAPLDLLRASDLLHERRNLAYHAYLLGAVKRGYLYPGTSLPADLQRAARSAGTLREIDDTVTARLHGFSGVTDYYRKASCLPKLQGVTVPTLLIHAVDDPFVPALPYRHLRGHAAATVGVLLAEGGGHVGFHDRQGLWHLRQVERAWTHWAGAKAPARRAIS